MSALPPKADILPDVPWTFKAAWTAITVQAKKPSSCRNREELISMAYQSSHLSRRLFIAGSFASPLLTAFPSGIAQDQNS
jgi:hypothetical protein